MITALAARWLLTVVFGMKSGMRSIGRARLPP